MAKLGRPPMPAGQSKSSMFALRLQPSEREAIEAEAKKSGQDVSEWMRSKLVGDAKPVKVTRTVLEYGDGQFRMIVNTPSPLPMKQWRILVGYVTEVLRPAEADGEPEPKCGKCMKCGGNLTLVRPGKHQCDHCEQESQH